MANDQSAESASALRKAFEVALAEIEKIYVVDAAVRKKLSAVVVRIYASAVASRHPDVDHLVNDVAGASVAHLKGVLAPAADDVHLVTLASATEPEL